MELNALTLGELKSLVFAQYTYASTCLRASAATLYGSDDAQNYLDAPDYFVEIIDTVEKIREITREIRRREHELSNHDAPLI